MKGPVMGRLKRTQVGSKGFCEQIDVDAIREYIEGSSETSSIYLGVDSKRFKKKGKWYASYARAIVIHKNSKNGCKVFGDIVTEPAFGDFSKLTGKEREAMKTASLRGRLLREVELVIELVEEFWDVIGDRPMEVHLDINPSELAGSSVVIKEAVGWVRGQLGMDPKVKPEAFAATYAADMAAKRKLIAPQRIVN